MNIYIHIYSLISFSPHPPSNEKLSVRNQCFHYVPLCPWRKLQCHPWASPLLCGLNRITEAIFLFYFKQQQKRNGGEEPCGYFLIMFTMGGWNTLPLSEVSESLQCNSGQFRQQRINSVRRTPSGRKGPRIRLYPQPFLKTVNFFFWEVRGRRGGH